MIYLTFENPWLIVSIIYGLSLLYMGWLHSVNGRVSLKKRKEKDI